MCFLVFTSCNKPPENGTKGPNCSDTQTKYITPEISNFKFKKGTYWIFIDSATFVIDTMRIDTASGGIVPYQYCPNNKHEYYSFQIKPKDIYSNSDSYSLEGNRLMRNQRYEDGSGDEIFIGSALKLDSMFVYDRYYKSVEGYPKNSDPSEDGNKTIYYINAEFGFLKKEVFIGSSNWIKSQKLLKDKFIIR